MVRAFEVAELNQRFEIPGIAKIVTGQGELTKVMVTSPHAQGEIYLHGAHVTSWKPAGNEDVLFVSDKSQWTDSRPIRGGVPICFPWFSNKQDDANAPLHGFARITTWQLESIVQNDDAVTVSLLIESDDATKKWWPADFRLNYRVTFGSSLVLEMEVSNTGTNAIRFEEALHTYYRVGNVEMVRLEGLAGVQYLDKVDEKRQKTQAGTIAIVSETDRVYLNTDATVNLKDPTLHREIKVTKENSMTTVIWNPWIQKAKAMADFGDEEWPQMVCIETCNVADSAVDLAPGQQHRMRALVSLSK
ncbi:D-hexose-6-phosphate mutarotase [Schlesneria paludicola]|uniref:D-hexose-6-phosphate mutarotase n=1 Tax=Schlesneria paludicola TaxID=360056 RepID=UPI00029ADC08|nr:D-hexose-6-phosphate mutarotase [Schlesneria paludicola]